MVSRNEVEAEALKMPRGERVELAEKLIHSLEEDQGNLKKWVSVAKKRYEQIKSGEVKTIPADEAFERARKAILE